MIIRDHVRSSAGVDREKCDGECPKVTVVGRMPATLDEIPQKSVKREAGSRREADRSLDSSGIREPGGICTSQADRCTSPIVVRLWEISLVELA